MASGDHQSRDTWVARVNALLDDVTQTIERLATHISETFRHTDPDAENRRSSSRQTRKNDLPPDAGEPPKRIAPSSAGSRSPSTAVTDAGKARPPLNRF